MKTKKVLVSIMNIAIMLGFFIGGFTTSCASKTPKVDRSLQKYAEEFSKEVKVPMVLVNKASMSFETLPQTEETRTLGQCNYYTQKIKIDPEYFYKNADRNVRAVIYHELMHCVCYEDHDDELKEDGCAVTIMNSHLPELKCLKKHWDYYMTDLNKRCFSPAKE